MKIVFFIFILLYNIFLMNFPTTLVISSEPNTKHDLEFDKNEVNIQKSYFLNKEIIDQYEKEINDLELSIEEIQSSIFKDFLMKAKKINHFSSEMFNFLSKLHEYIFVKNSDDSDKTETKTINRSNWISSISIPKTEGIDIYQFNLLYVFLTGGFNTDEKTNVSKDLYKSVLNYEKNEEKRYYIFNLLNDIVQGDSIISSYKEDKIKDVTNQFIDFSSRFICPVLFSRKVSQECKETSSIIPRFAYSTFLGSVLEGFKAHKISDNDENKVIEKLYQVYIEYMKDMDEKDKIYLLDQISLIYKFEKWKNTIESIPIFLDILKDSDSFKNTFASLYVNVKGISDGILINKIPLNVVIFKKILKEDNLSKLRYYLEGVYSLFKYYSENL